MALYSGITGKISTKPDESGTETSIAHMANWSVSLSKEILEVISFGDDYKEKVPSIKDWSASFDGTADFDAAGGQKALVDAFESGELLVYTYYLDENTFMQGSGYIESLELSHAADGKGDISISVAGSNAVALSIPTETP